MIDFLDSFDAIMGDKDYDLDNVIAYSQINDASEVANSPLIGTWPNLMKQESLNLQIL